MRAPVCEGLAVERLEGGPDRVEGEERVRRLEAPLLIVVSRAVPPKAVEAAPSDLAEVGARARPDHRDHLLVGLAPVLLGERAQVVIEDGERVRREIELEPELILHHPERREGEIFHHVRGSAVRHREAP